MPCIGQSSFPLLSGNPILALLMVMCQCPASGNHHFHFGGRMKKEILALCQCPASGNHHFHLVRMQKKKLVKRRVNALHRAIIISTHTFYDENGNERGCVNALHRAIIISTCRDLGATARKNLVSMPCIGQSSFPLSASGKQQIEITEGVNALHRAIIISTLMIGCNVQAQSVSMPCIGQSSFPQCCRLHRCLHAGNVSMPCIGQSSFPPHRCTCSFCS